MYTNTNLKTVTLKLFLLTGFLFFLKNADAQKRYGLMAGAGKTSLYRFQFSVEDYNKYSSTTSYWGGLTADFPLTQNGLNLFTSAIYNKRGYQYKLENATGATNTIKDSTYSQDLNYVDINLTLLKKFSWNETSSFVVGTGPSANLFLTGSEKTEMSYFGNNVTPVNSKETKLTVGNTPGAYKRVFFSWGFRVGFELNKFNIWLNYQFPLVPYYQDANKAVQHKLKTYGINVGYTLFTTNKEKREKREKKEKTALPEKIAVDSLADTDGDGIRDVVDKCPGHKGTAKYFGCPVPDSDGDGINDDEDKCPLVAGVASRNGCPEFTDSIKTIQKDTLHYTIYFEPAKSILRSEGYAVLTDVVNRLKANSKLVVVFKGHTDNVGSVEANSIRAFERAMVCADYVASFYINRDRLVTSAYGNTMPAADLTDPLLQWKNRRVEILVFEKD